MTRLIDDQLLSPFSEFVTARFGLHFPKKRWRDLAQKIVAVTNDFGFDDPASCIQWLLSAQLTRGQLDTLAGRLTIGETYFFRERNSFDALEADILPELIGSRRGKEQRLRIWSAGCSTGEEPYSIAMLLKRMVADLPRWNTTILATDLNPESLRRAARGEYGDWSFRGLPGGVKERYFRRNGEGRFEIAAEVKKMVNFSQLNLAEDPYPSLANNTNAMDIIFCRNVLMYFTPQLMAEVIERFHHALVDGGWLIVSPCETSHTLFRRFEAVNLRDAICYRKRGSGKPAVIVPPVTVTGDTPAPLLLTETAPGTPPFSFSAPHFPQPQAAPKVAEKAAEPQVSPYDEALTLYRQGLYAEAAGKLAGADAERKREFEPPLSGKAASLLARIFANLGEFAKALEWSEKAIAVNKLDPELRYLQAIIFQEQGAVEAAVAALKKTLYLDQAFVLAHFALANLFVQQGKGKDATRHLENAAGLLMAYGDDDLLPGSEGLSARRLEEIIAATRTSVVNSALSH
jgi:chemotaxis protein methyltransferase CheR